MFSCQHFADEQLLFHTYFCPNFEKHQGILASFQVTWDIYFLIVMQIKNPGDGKDPGASLQMIYGTELQLK